MKIQAVKQEVWRYTFGYYNIVRITTVTEDGFSANAFNEKVASGKSVA